MTNNRYTIYARYPDCIEEVDVDAPNATEAMRLARAELDEHYDAGYEIIECEQRFGLYC